MTASCPYCRAPEALAAGRCRGCDADLSIGPTPLGLAAVATLLAGYATVALAAYAWCYQPTGWLHSRIDPLVRGAGHVVPSEPPFSSSPLRDVVTQILLPTVPLVVMAFGIRIFRRNSVGRPVFDSGTQPRRSQCADSPTWP